MKLRFIPLLAVCLFVAACSPSIEEIQIVLKEYLAGLDEEEQPELISVEQTDKNIYSGNYGVAPEGTDMVFFVYPFTAIIKGNQVTNFFKETDDSKVAVFTLKPSAVPDENGEFSEDDFLQETKKDYTERIRREEERQARYDEYDYGLGEIGAKSLLSGRNDITRVISYQRISGMGTRKYEMMYGPSIDVYKYKVVEEDGWGGKVTQWDVVFRDGDVVYAKENANGVLENAVEDIIFGALEEAIKQGSEEPHDTQ